MLEMDSKIRKWGRSMGVVIPMEKIREAHLREDEAVKILIKRKTNPLKETFGMLLFKRSTKDILEDADKECWDE